MANTAQHRAGGTGGRTPPLSKADAFRRLSRFKKGITVAAVLGLGVIGGAIATQPPWPSAMAAATARHATASTAAPSATATAQHGFFSQGQGGTNVGSASSAQTPVAGSGTS